MKNRIILAIVLAAVIVGCGGPAATVFLHQEYSFGFVERVAVLPFENVAREQGAGERATRFFLTELLAAEAFDVVEPGEVNRATIDAGVITPASITRDQIKELGRALGVQALFIGTVSEATTMRQGSSQSNVVTLNARLVETESGQTIWSASNTSKGRGFWNSLFGGGGKSKSEVMRRCVGEILKTLIR